MRKSRFTDEKIVGILQEAERSGKSGEVIRRDLARDVLSVAEEVRRSPVERDSTPARARGGEPATQAHRRRSGAVRVVAVLERLRATRGLPQRITVDNGPEFQSKALDAWAHHNHVQLVFSRPGKPVDNTFIEAFNGRVRDECLNQHWFLSLADARCAIERWRESYNTTRPIVH